jgi:hypothetical protein
MPTDIPPHTALVFHLSQITELHLSDELEIPLGVIQSVFCKSRPRAACAISLPSSTDQ